MLIRSHLPGQYRHKFAGEIGLGGKLTGKVCCHHEFSSQGYGWDHRRRWFTEGLAQRIEYQVSGYLWIEQDSTLRQKLYSLDELEKRFDRLSNQPLAIGSPTSLSITCDPATRPTVATEAVGYLDRGLYDLWPSSA